MGPCHFGIVSLPRDISDNGGKMINNKTEKVILIARTSRLENKLYFSVFGYAHISRGPPVTQNTRSWKTIFLFLLKAII